MSSDATACLMLQFTNWRKRQGHSRSRLAEALDVSSGRIARWETGRVTPEPFLRHRIYEIMREDGPEKLALHKHLISGLESFVALLDVNETRLIVASRGLQALWPDLGQRVGEDLRPHVPPAARALMEDRAFLRQVRQGQVVYVNGACERPMAGNAGPGTRHRWSASFRSYGTRLVAEIWYDALLTDGPVGIHEVRRFRDLIPF